MIIYQVQESQDQCPNHVIFRMNKTNFLTQYLNKNMGPREEIFKPVPYTVELVYALIILRIQKI